MILIIVLSSQNSWKGHMKDEKQKTARNRQEISENQWCNSWIVFLYENKYLLSLSFENTMF